MNVLLSDKVKHEYRNHASRTVDSTGLFPKLTIISGLEFGRVSKVCKANLLRFLEVLNFSVLVKPENLNKSLKYELHELKAKKHINWFHLKPATYNNTNSALKFKPSFLHFSLKFKLVKNGSYGLANFYIIIDHIRF